MLLYENKIMGSTITSTFHGASIEMQINLACLWYRGKICPTL